MGAFRTQTGAIVNVPDDEAESARASGLVDATPAEVGAFSAAPEKEERGAVGAINAGATGLLSGLTLGLSDVALSGLMDTGQRERLASDREEHGGISGASQFAGALLPALVTGGATAAESAAGGIGRRIMAATPAALTSDLGHAVGGAIAGEGAGLAARAIASTAGAAAEGALYGGGDYLSQVALEDKPLSAEGFVGAMGKGALFAAPIGGGLTLAGEALMRAKALFPRHEVTAAAAKGIEGEATSALGQAITDGDVMAEAAKRKLELGDANQSIAESGEQVTRRVFGASDPNALLDQAATAVDRSSIEQAIGRYESAKNELTSWVAQEADPELERLLGGALPVPEVGEAGGTISKVDPELERILGKIDVPEVGEAGGSIQRRIGKEPSVAVGEFGAPGGGGFKSQEELQAMVSDRAPELAGGDQATRAGRPKVRAPDALINGVGDATNPGRRPSLSDDVNARLDSGLHQIHPGDGSGIGGPSAKHGQPLPGLPDEVTNTRLKAAPGVAEGRDKLAFGLMSALDDAGQLYPESQAQIREAFDDIVGSYGMHPSNKSSKNALKVKLTQDELANAGAQGGFYSHGTDQTGLIIIPPKQAALLRQHAALDSEQLAHLGKAAESGDEHAIDLMYSSHIATHEAIHGYGPGINPGPGRTALEELTTELAARRITADMHDLPRTSRIDALMSYHAIVDSITNSVVAETGLPAESVYYAMQQAAVDFKGIRTQGVDASHAAYQYGLDLGARLGIKGEAAERFGDDLSKQILYTDSLLKSGGLGGEVADMPFGGPSLIRGRKTSESSKRLGDMSPAELHSARSAIDQQLKSLHTDSDEFANLQHMRGRVDEEISEAASGRRPQPPPEGVHAGGIRVPSGFRAEPTNSRIAAQPKLEAGRKAIVEALSNPRERFSRDGGFDTVVQKKLRAGLDDIVEAYGISPRAPGSRSAELKVARTSRYPGDLHGKGSDGERWPEGSGHTGLIVLRKEHAELLAEHARVDGDGLLDMGRRAKAGDASAMNMISVNNLAIHEAIHGHGPRFSGAQGLEEITTELAARRISADMHGMSRMLWSDGPSAYRSVIDVTAKAIALETGLPTERVYYAMQQAAVDFKSRTGSLSSRDAYAAFATDLGKRLGVPAELSDQFSELLTRGISFSWIDRAGRITGSGASASRKSVDDLRSELADLDGKMQSMDFKSAEYKAANHRFEEISRKVDELDSGVVSDDLGSSPRIPTYADLTSQGLDYAEQTIPASSLRERGYYELPGQGEDKVKAGKARQAIAEGQRDPVSLVLSPSGKITVNDGRNRLAAALEADKPVRVRWSTGAEPASGDVLKHGAGIAPEADDLLAKLSATKSQLEQGHSLKDIGASVRGEYVSAKASKTAEAAEHFRAKANAENYGRSSMAEAESSAQLPRDVEPITLNKSPAAVGGPDDLARLLGVELKPEPEVIRGDKSQAPREHIPRGSPRTMIDPEMLDRMRGVADDASIQRAINKHNGKNVNVGPSMNRAAKAIGDFESASATLVDVLGPQAPLTAKQQAAVLRAAQKAQAESAAAQAAKAGQAIDGQVGPAVQAASGGKGAGALGHLANAGTALEVLRAMGVHVPDVSAIPVIGPVLSLYLKARAAMGILKRKGGSIGRSTEGVIAAKAAETQDRINAAVGAAFEGAGKSAKRNAMAAGGVGGALAYKLFPGGGKEQGKTPVQLYHARMDEIARAQQPGAVAAAVADRIHTADPAMQDAIAAQVQRGIDFIASKAPLQTMQATLIPGDGKWHPSKAALDEWAKYIAAVHDPAGVLEDLARGVVSMESAEALRVVYPELFAKAQQMLLANAEKIRATLPYPRRILIATVYRVPVDGTMTPQHMQFLHPPQPVMPTNGASGGGPPTGGPAITGPLKTSQTMMTTLDRRAGV